MTLEHGAELETKTGEVIKGSNPEAIASQLVPYYPEDGKKATYLKFRVTGFGVNESCLLADVHHKTVLLWRRKDPEFRAIDTSNLESLRQNLAAKYLGIEFTRNFALFLQKDFRILMKDALGVPLSLGEHQYMAKVRTMYTPQQLGELKSLADEFKNPAGNVPTDFTKLVFTLKREREEVTVAASQ